MLEQGLRAQGLSTQLVRWGYTPAAAARYHGEEFGIAWKPNASVSLHSPPIPRVVIQAHKEMPMPTSPKDLDLANSQKCPAMTANAISTAIVGFHYGGGEKPLGS